jgi:hypothetical protein
MNKKKERRKAETKRKRGENTNWANYLQFGPAPHSHFRAAQAGMLLAQ